MNDYGNQYLHHLVSRNYFRIFDNRHKSYMHGIVLKDFLGILPGMLIFISLNYATDVLDICYTHPENIDTISKKIPDLSWYFYDEKDEVYNIKITVDSSFRIKIVQHYEDI